ncbi:MAG TPA: serine/threonine-protein kinase [Urbifossiella sp.]|nr:serine/threonine-protein kinase [Urbifossiella sp.]
MAAPVTVVELVDRLRKSRLVPIDRLDGFLDGLRASGHSPATIDELLTRMIDAGMITQFHADKLAAGKYRGFEIGNYLILDQIGTGGMGQVYLAEHSSMRRLVALKVFPPYAADDAVAKERFLREARAAAALDHPNIVRVFDLCQEGRILTLVMEYVEGISLQALVSRHGPLEVATACHYARQVAFGLQHAHELGYIHRDIKPANLLLDRAGVVRILDLGLVRSEADAGSGLTQQLDGSSILGTADYVAPEQAVDSSNVDIRADLYSLGATLYFLLSGRPLFPEGRTAQKLMWQQNKEPTPIDRLRPEVDAGLAAVIHTMLQKRPDDRYQNMHEAFEALAPWDLEDVPPPRDEWIPQPAARVMASRAALPSASAPRASGSTSQILALAMRSGSGTTGMAATLRSGDKGGSNVIATPGTRPIVTDPGETDRMQGEETQRTPAQPLRWDDPLPGARPHISSLNVVVAVGMIALAAAMIAIAARFTH